MREHIYRVEYLCSTLFTSALHFLYWSFPSIVCWSSKQNSFFPLCTFSVNRVMNMLLFILLILTRQLSKAFAVPDYCWYKFISKCTQRHILSPLGFMDYLRRRHCQTASGKREDEYTDTIWTIHWWWYFFYILFKSKGFFKCGMIFQHVQKSKRH